MSTLTQLDYLKFTDSYQSKYFDQQVAHKYLLKLEDQNVIETTVYLHYLKGKSTALAIDISTMIGCPMDCKFCESSSINFKRKLSTKEMISQVDFIFDKIDHTSFPQIMLSFQGIGEPSLVSDNILEFCNIYKEDKYSISIATMGYNLVAFKKWRESEKIIANLQISFAGENQYALIPKAPTFDDLMNEALLCISSGNFTQVKFNYILIEGVTDTDRHVQMLIKSFSKSPVIIKISSLNETTVARKYNLKSSSLARAQFINEKLLDQQINSYIYGSFNSSQVGCGQLAFLNRI